ncbi:MAG: hypothetical protein IIT50_00275, partial [Bacteroidales bacterium]|nr:hypothetical protein [Bacteroidales bacterium]
KNAISKAFLSVDSFATQEVLIDVMSRLKIYDGISVEVSEIAITDHQDTPPVIVKEARVKFRDQLTEKVSAFTDENFWENYNVIEPDADIDAIVRKIVRQLKKHNLD